jgi:hypothetical protein
MKVLKKRAVVATSSDKSKMPQCGFCGEKKPLMLYTEGMKLVCNQCAEKSDAKEYVDNF